MLVLVRKANSMEVLLLLLLALQTITARAVSPPATTPQKVVFQTGFGDLEFELFHEVRPESFSLHKCLLMTGKNRTSCHMLMSSSYGRWRQGRLSTS